MDIESNIKSKIDLILKNEINLQKKLFINPQNIDTIVLSGGGAKGIYFIGVLKKFEDLNIIQNINTFAGTSIGAFFCTVFAMGYTSKELADFIFLLKLDKIKNPSMNNFFQFFGIDDGNNIEIVLENMFKLKGFNKNTTFQEFYNKTKKEIILTGVCINDKKCYYFSHKTFPNMNIIKAIRISCSIPIYYNPVKFDNKYWVDGAVINNYPIDLFKNKLHKTIGFYITNKIEPSDINNLEDYLSNIVLSYFNGLDSRAIYGFENNTIIIKSEKISILDTNLTKENIIEIINEAYDLITLFFL
jgi:predicted acylesterase/phospholipase RssA